MSGRRGPISGSHAARKPGAKLRAVPPPGSPAPAADHADESSKLPPLPTEPPDWLSAVASRIYLDTLPHVIGRLTILDLEQLCAWCLAAAELRRLVKSRSRKKANEMRAQARVLNTLGGPLGLTPGGRARLPEPEAADPADGDEATQASQLR